MSVAEELNKQHTHAYIYVCECVCVINGLIVSIILIGLYQPC